MGNSADSADTLHRRAQPWLGTLVEISLRHADAASAARAADAGFARIAQMQAMLSRFEPDSCIARFNSLPAGAGLPLPPDVQHVLAAAAWLREHSAGHFDISQGSGCRDWQLRGGRLHKYSDQVSLDLGGIAKGYAVDRAIAVLRRAGASWGVVNAGGDLRVFGAQALTLRLRDEKRGGLREIGSLSEGAFASSYYGPGARSRLHGEPAVADQQVAVIAPSALWADALCKLAALGLEGESPLFERLHAQCLVWRD